MKPKKDLNKIAKIEQAIAKKYGEETIQNPAKYWDENKEKEYLELNKYLLNYYDIGGIDLALQYIDKKIINSKIYTSEELNPYYFNT